MTIKEVLKLLVETEDLDERMALVEEHNDLFEGITTEDGSEDSTELQEENERLKKELAEQKQKYRDRFFGGTEKEDEEKEETEEDEEEIKSLDEILKGGK